MRFYQLAVFFNLPDGISWVLHHQHFHHHQCDKPEKPFISLLTDIKTIAVKMLRGSDLYRFIKE